MARVGVTDAIDLQMHAEQRGCGVVDFARVTEITQGIAECEQGAFAIAARFRRTHRGLARQFADHKPHAGGATGLVADR